MSLNWNGRKTTSKGPSRKEPELSDPPDPSDPPDRSDPDTLKRLLFEFIESFEELAVLVWFHEHGEGTVGDAGDVARDTRTTEESAGSALVNLAKRGLLAASSAEPNRFLYAPTRKTHAAVARIARAYRDNPVEVMGHMTGNAIERVRTAAVRTFAESFRIRRPKSGG